ncbi:MAG: hypothetical protein KA319_04705 [Ferruginibacter sp.]|nr:hypothetical protein [Ferruginibacter sp.]
MKAIIVLLFISPILLFAQKEANEKNNPNRLGQKEYSLFIDKVAPSEIRLPFSKIEVIDNRFDTSKFGFVPANRFIAGRKNLFKKMVFKNSVANELMSHYNDFYSNAFTKNDLTLLIVIKKLWLSGISNKKNKELDIAENDYAAGNMYLKWEYYLRKKDTLMPIKRVDTIIKGLNYETIEINFLATNRTKTNSLRQLFEGMIEVFDFSVSVANIGKLPKKNWIQVVDFNKAYYDAPILKDSIVKNGIFLTFKEFKNNSPSIQVFKEKTIKYGLINKENYLEDEKGNRITTYWGYCKDGVIKIGKYGNDKLYRKNNTFEFFYKYKNAYTNTNAFGGNGAREDEVWFPYQLDMETGNIY